MNALPWARRSRDDIYSNGPRVPDTKCKQREHTDSHKREGALASVMHKRSTRYEEAIGHDGNSEVFEKFRRAVVGVLVSTVPDQQRSLVSAAEKAHEANANGNRKVRVIWKRQENSGDENRAKEDHCGRKVQADLVQILSRETLGGDGDDHKQQPDKGCGCRRGGEIEVRPTRQATVSAWRVLPRCCV